MANAGQAIQAEPRSEIDAHKELDKERKPCADRLVLCERDAAAEGGRGGGRRTGEERGWLGARQAWHHNGDGTSLSQ